MLFAVYPMIITKFIELSLLCIAGGIVIGGFLTYPGMTLVCVFGLSLVVGKLQEN